MAKKSGLHKNVSSIFDGMTLPQEQAGGDPLAAATTDKKERSGAGGFLDIGPRQKKMALVVGVLALVFGFIVLKSVGVFDSTPKKAAATESHAAIVENTAPAAAAEAPAAPKPANDPFALMAWERPAVFESFSRDPMQPIKANVVPEAAGANSSPAAATTSIIKVAGIVYSATRPSAIIGQEVMHEGDVVQGVKIVKIMRDRVVLEQNGKSWEQTMEGK